MPSHSTTWWSWAACCIPARARTTPRCNSFVVPRPTDATLVGICTGVFSLMRAGVLDGYRICVSWFHYWDFVERFPGVNEEALVADRLFVIDHRRITCSGGRASIDVAAAILLRHFEAATVQKALRILLGRRHAEGQRAANPHPPGLAPAAHPKVKRAILLMEQHVGRSLSLDELAHKLDLSTRQLERLFKAETGKAPQAYAKQVRLRTAAWLLTSSDKTVADIASSCGFSDASHLGREFRKQFGLPPMMYREQRGTRKHGRQGKRHARRRIRRNLSRPRPGDLGTVRRNQADCLRSVLGAWANCARYALLKWHGE